MTRPTYSEALRAATTRQAEQRAARRWPPHAERRHLGAAVRRDAARPARSLWAAHHLLQPLRTMAEDGLRAADGCRHRRPQ